MSQASELIADVKSLTADVAKEIKAFEGEFEELGHFTDLAHLNIAKIHLSELRNQLVNRRDDIHAHAELEKADDVADETEPQPDSQEQPTDEDSDGEGEPEAPESGELEDGSEEEPNA